MGTSSPKDVSNHQKQGQIVYRASLLFSEFLINRSSRINQKYRIKVVSCDQRCVNKTEPT